MSYLLSRQATRFATKPLVSRPFSGSIASWEGRKVEDHAVNRDGKDVQSATSQASMQDKAKGDTDRSHGLSQTSGGQDEKAKKEHPKAPEPIIGMNDERGQKGGSH